MELICLQIDLARQKENFDFIKNYVDFASKYGYNTIVLYLENAVRTNETEYFDHSETYSLEEMATIVGYITAKGMQAIPAFENLGHLEKFFLYPQLENLSECSNTLVQGRGFESLKRGSCGCVSNPELNEFLDRYIKDVCSVFTSEYVHMGLDEPFDFAVCDKCASKLESGITKSELFLQHILHNYELVKSMGRTMMMWDDFFQYADVVAHLPRDIIFCNWNYSFIGDELPGHWTNRIKKDWFRLYEELGFRYMFCTYAHRASSLYNIDSFTDYASKFKPMGAIMTAWERANSFYYGAYPCIAYAGRRWSDCVKSEIDKISIYAETLDGNFECAQLVLALNVIPSSGGYHQIAKFAECDYLAKWVLRDSLRYAVLKLKGHIGATLTNANCVLTDIYDFYLENFTYLRLQRLGADVFDHFESGNKVVEDFIGQLQEIDAAYLEIEENSKRLWEYCRRGIKSTRDSFRTKFTWLHAQINDIKEELLKKEDVGVLYFDTMLHDGYCTVRVQLEVKYCKDERIYTIYEGKTKPSIVSFDVGGCYGFRFATQRKEIEYLIISVFGEGALYPLNARYLVNGKKYIADNVEVLSGRVVNAKNLLENDTQFVEIGCNSGKAHFNDISVSKQRHEVKVTFRAMVNKND